MDIKPHRRFDRVARLVGDDGLSRLLRAHVVVVGCGGVGSWAAESLARSGVGRITLVDFDRVCTTNVNRQLHAMVGTVGKPKVEVMAERLRRIAPSARIDAVQTFYEESTRDQILGPEVLPSEGEQGAAPCTRPDWVIDAIDNVTAKLDLLISCRARGIPVVASMGAAGRLDPTRVRIADIGHTYKDGLARDVRKLLVRNHGLVPAEDGTLGIAAVYSDEPLLAPADVAADHDEGFRCVCPKTDAEKHSCDRRARIDGTASFVTGTFGLAAASWVVRALVERADIPRVLETRRMPRSAASRLKPRVVSR